MTPKARAKDATTTNRSLRWLTVIVFSPVALVVILLVSIFFFAMSILAGLRTWAAITNVPPREH